MIQLPNGCRCSELSVFPDNWKSKGASLSVNWYVFYRFYDPVNCPKGYPVQIKNGINRLQTIAERRAMADDLIIFEKDKLIREGYNPKTKLFAPPINSEDFIEPSTPFISALKQAQEKLKVANRTYSDITAIIRTLNKAAVMLNMHYMPVSEVKRRNIKALLEQVGKISKSWSAHNYNKYRTYLMILYKELLEQEAVESNIIKDVSTQKKVNKVRPVLTDEQRPMVNDYLKENHYNFWLFLNIFFHSGSRITEIMLLKGSGVDMANQKFKVMVLKGKEYREVVHTIKDVALPFWMEVMKDCKPEHYVFSVGLVPGDKAIRSDQITKRWYRLVKNKLGIEADFYSLKHIQTTETVTNLSEQDAASHNGHTTTSMVAKVYDINSADRLHERLKKSGSKFA